MKRWIPLPMIDNISKLSKKVIWARPIAYLMVVGFIALFGYSVIFRNAGDTDVYLIPSVLGLIWSLLLVAITLIFPNVPSKVNSNDKFFKRIKVGLQRGVYYLIGLLFLILTIAIIVLSIKTFGIWREDHFS